MKKFLLLLVFVGVVCLNVIAQEAKEPQSLSELLRRGKKSMISSDHVDADGNRFVFGEFKSGDIGSSIRDLKNNNNVAMRICAYGNDHDTFFELSFRLRETHSLSIKKNSPVLLKFGNDSVYVGRCIETREDKIGDVISLMGITDTYYTISVNIDLTNDILTGLQTGLKKVRLEVNNDIFNVTFKKDVLSEYLLEQYKVVCERMKVKRDFTEGF